MSLNTRHIRDFLRMLAQCPTQLPAGIAPPGSSLLEVAGMSTGRQWSFAWNPGPE